MQQQWPLCPIPHSQPALSNLPLLQSPSQREAAIKQPYDSSSDGGQFQHWSEGPDCAACMGRIYEAVSKAGQPNYRGISIQLPSNLQFKECAPQAHVEEDGCLIEYLRYGFLVGYKGPVPTNENNIFCSPACMRCDGLHNYY